MGEKQRELLLDRALVLHKGKKMKDVIEISYESTVPVSANLLQNNVLS